MSPPGTTYAPPVQIPIVGSGDSDFKIMVMNPNDPSGALTVQLDTGSTGLVVPASFFFVGGVYQPVAGTTEITGELLPGVVMGGPATIHYEPSSNDINGFYFTVPALMIGLDNGRAAATAVNVKAIGAVGTNPHMMGIGFGRPVVADNPFLCISGMADGTMYASYQLTTKGIWLGCTPEQANTRLGASTFGFQKLSYTGTAPQPRNSSEWSTPIGYFRVSGLNPDVTQYGVLIDTGVELMMVKSDIPNMETAIAAGSTIELTIPGAGATPILSYSFKILGSQNVVLGPKQPPRFVFTTVNTPNANVPSPQPMAPEYVVPLGTGAFVNTGIHVIRGYQLYFDAQVGQVGYATYPA